MKIIKGILIFILVLVIAVVGGAYAYLSSDPNEEMYDDYKQYQKESLVLKDYLAYNPGTTDLTMTIDKNFIYSVIDVDSIAEQLQQYDVTLEKVGFDFEDGNKVNVYISAKYKNFIPVHLKADGDFSYDSFVVTGKLNGVHIGSKIDLDDQFLMEKLQIESLEYTTKLNDDEIREIFASSKYDSDIFKIDTVLSDAVILKVNIKDYAYQATVKLVNSIDRKEMKENFYAVNGSIENAANKFFVALDKNLIQALNK